MNTKRDKNEKNVFRGKCRNLLGGCHMDKDCRYCATYQPIGVNPPAVVTDNQEKNHG